jgi:L-lactate dehydrogenase (cytochrome)
VSERVVRLVDELGFRGIMLTVDTPVLGKREKDIRMHLPTRDTDEDIPRTGVLVSPDSFLDANLQWSDIAWLKAS